MPSPNEDFLQEMLDDLFDVILANANVNAIADGWGPDPASSSRVFRLYDGRKLPVLADGNVEATALPALYVPTIEPSVIEQETTPTTELVQLSIPIRVAFGNDAAHKPFPSLSAMAAAMTIEDAISTRSNLDNGLGSNIDEFDVGLDDLVAVSPENDPRRVLYWDAGLVVQIRRQRVIPQ